jgi:hypothetical protein
VASADGSRLLATGAGLAGQAWPAFVLTPALRVGVSLDLGPIRPSRRWR